MPAAEPPVGGSKGLCDESTAVIDATVEWTTPTPLQLRPRPLVFFLKQRYGLTAHEAAQAITEDSQKVRASIRSVRREAQPGQKGLDRAKARLEGFRSGRFFFAFGYASGST